MHTCTHEHLLKTFCFKGLKSLLFVNISSTFSLWILKKRNTREYSFKVPKIDELMSVIPEIESPTDFQRKYGSIISLMKLRMKEGILPTLVQFYDLMYQCFIFHDYQLMPTLEEYSYLLGLPITDHVPFTGLEVGPKSHEIVV